VRGSGRRRLAVGCRVVGRYNELSRLVLPEERGGPLRALAQEGQVQLPLAIEVLDRQVEGGEPRGMLSVSPNVPAPFRRTVTSLEVGCRQDRGFRLESLEFAMAPAATTTDGCYRQLIDAGFQRSLQ
jgi:hypothetical protein